MGFLGFVPDVWHPVGFTVDKLTASTLVER